nr:hypothetical protein [Actinomycetota bacterium]
MSGGGDDGIERVDDLHDLWVVATQDCDLDRHSTDDDRAEVELRPVYEDGTPSDWGIRSRKLRLTGGQFVAAQSPRVMISAAALDTFRGGREPPLPDGRAKALKRWLGLRYDRPAVPNELVALGRTISAALREVGSRPEAADVHDVLMQFDEGTDPPRFALFAVVEDAADKEGVRAWLVEGSLRVPAEIGVGYRFEAITRDEASLALLDDSYSADTSDVTWHGEQPEGAE